MDTIDTMTKLIVDQVLQMNALEEELRRKETALKEIKWLIICCGGPLNDNFLRYSREQLVIFDQILRLIEGAS